MPQRQRATVIDVATALGGGEQGTFPFPEFAVQALAQGDSWFSIGTLPPGKTTNLLLEMKTARRTVIVQCARPGAVLRRFTDTTHEQDFLRMMNGPLARRWSVILLSGGGNDVIAAAGSDPTEPPQRRLLRTPAERGAGMLPASEYISEPGWQTFTDHMRTVFNALLDLRDRGPNLRVPMVMHNYARARPRPSGAGFGQGPWLLPALERYGVAKAEQLPVAEELFGRLSHLLAQLMDERRAIDPPCNLHLVDTAGLAGVVLADEGSRGPSGDWVNEIHLTRGGYRKCAAVWADRLDAIPA
jgi:hypothetical protein